MTSTTLGLSLASVETHDDADYAAAEDVGLPVAAVARRLGVAAGTLRTWDRRYGLGASDHRAGSHRRYDRRDLERLVVMRRLTLEGVAPVDAARAALASSDDVTPSWSSRADDIPGARPAPREERPAHPATPLDVPVGDVDRDERLVPEPPWGQRFDRNAVTLDPEQTATLVTEAFDHRGLVQGWEQIIGPTVHALSRRWATCGPGYDAELMLTSAVLSALRERTVPDASPDATVLLAPAEDERDTLALHVLAAELASRGVSTQVLAPGRPSGALAGAVAATRPAAVLVLATVPVREVSQLDDLADRLHGGSLVLAGPGWESADVPAGHAEVVASLEGAIDVVAAHALRAGGAR